MALTGNQAHFDTVVVLVKAGAVFKQFRLKIGVQLPVDDIEDIQVERGGNAAGVIVSCFQDGAGLDQVGANQQATVASSLLKFAYGLSDFAV